jgi:hypothetical protein
MGYIYLSDLGQSTGGAAIPGGIASILTVYPDLNTAIKKGYGMLYRDQSGKLTVTGPGFGISVTDPNTIYPDMNSALRKGYGYIYTQSGNFYLSGPAGPLTINSPPTADAAAQLSAATGAVNPTAKTLLSAIASGTFQPLPAQPAGGAPVAGSASPAYVPPSDATTSYGTPGGIPSDTGVIAPSGPAQPAWRPPYAGGAAAPDQGGLSIGTIAAIGVIGLGGIALIMWWKGSKSAAAPQYAPPPPPYPYPYAPPQYAPQYAPPPPAPVARNRHSRWRKEV